jgi:hypothetical protein
MKVTEVTLPLTFVGDMEGDEGIEEIQHLFFRLKAGVSLAFFGSPVWVRPDNENTLLLIDDRKVPFGDVCTFLNSSQWSGKIEITGIIEAETSMAPQKDEKFIALVFVIRASVMNFIRRKGVE